MQLSYYPAPALRITGSEESTTHKGTKCLDQALNSNTAVTDTWLYAPFDCKIWRIYGTSNGLFLTSVEPVQTPTFVDRVSFYIGHMNDEDFLPLKYVVGQTIKQGQKFYRQGVKGYATGSHVHLNFGRGTFLGNGWAKNSVGNWGITTTGGETHIWETTYLKTGTQKLVGTSAASNYPWVYEPIPAVMKPVKDMSIVTGDVAVNIRWKPSTKFAAIGQAPLKTKIKIVEQSTDKVDGFEWVRLDGSMDRYVALVSSIQLIDEAAEAAKLAAEAEAKRLADLEAERLRLEKLAAEKEAARLAAEAEAKRLAAEQQAIRLAAEAEAERLRLEAENSQPAPEPTPIPTPIPEPEPIPEPGLLTFTVSGGGYSILRIASLYRVPVRDIALLNPQLKGTINTSLPNGTVVYLPKNAVAPYSQPVNDLRVGVRVKIIGKQSATGFPIPQYLLVRTHRIVKIQGNMITLENGIIVYAKDLRMA